MRKTPNGTRTLWFIRLGLVIGGFAVVTTIAYPTVPAPIFQPGNLVLAHSYYTGTASTVTVGEQLPPDCQNATPPSCVSAVADGTYPYVFNNSSLDGVTIDGSFGITSPIYLDQMTTGGAVLNSMMIPASLGVTTSFSSKSELAINLSQDGTKLTFIGYIAPPNTLDVSNSNTPQVPDSTNPVVNTYYRAVVQVDANGNYEVTPVNAFSGDNGRAAIMSDTGLYFMAGNSNNGSSSPPFADLVAATGAQVATPGQPATTLPQQVGSFSITQLGHKADKAGKDNNFRGLTIFNNTLYVSKGSGSNGINTVYQVGSSGKLPASPWGVPIDILPGFNTALAKNPPVAADYYYPFGIWFANANTLYVADEGDGAIPDAALSPLAGLQKYTFNGSTWSLDYVLQKGLNLGQQYSVPSYPTALNPATDGLRNITGRVNADGTVTIWAITSTVSNSGDQGADPNKLVMITDVLANTDPSAAASEEFTTLRTAVFGEVLRGVAFTPGTTTLTPPSIPVTASGLTYNRVTGTYNGTVTITNNSSSAIGGPLYVLLKDLTPGVTLVGDDASALMGYPAVLVLAAGTSLSPGQSATAAIAFSNPDNVKITFLPAVQ
jgi:hypothetical protein